MRGPDLGSARELEFVGETDLIIRRIERIHELGRLITASETKGSIRSAPNFCMYVYEVEGMTLHILHKSKKLVDQN